MARPPLDLATLNAVIATCGCCPLPRCCPPLLQCLSYSGGAQAVGFKDSDSDSDSDLPDWKRPSYLSKVQTLEYIADPDIYSENFFYGEYLSRAVTTNYKRKYIQFYDQPFSASIGPQLVAPCRFSAAQFRSRCEATGGFTVSYYALVYWNGEWVHFKDYEIVATYRDVEGERTDEHIQWESDYDAWLAAHPDYEGEVEDWEAAHAAWEIAYAEWEDEYAAYIVAYNEWWSGDQLDPEPEPPGDAPVEPPPPEEAPSEPAEFYPPCTTRENKTYTRWKIQGDPGTVVLEESTEEAPNPYSTSSIGATIIGISGEWVETLEDPVTFAEFVAAAEDWFNSAAQELFDEVIAAGDSSSGLCDPGDQCGASKFASWQAANPWLPQLDITNFIYRWKLNKCCGYKSILSGWREVLFTAEYMAWFQSLAALGSEDEVPPPPVDLNAISPAKEWQWDGIPPLCNDSSSSGSSSEEEIDPFDHPAMWSPWSLMVFVPDGEEGIIGLRNYFQKCYGKIPDYMPAVTGQINLSDDIPDDWT